MWCVLHLQTRTQFSVSKWYQDSVLVSREKVHKKEQSEFVRLDRNIMMAFILSGSYPSVIFSV